MAASSATRTAHSTDAALDGVLARLAGVARSGAGYSARCPAHDDRAAWLSIGTGEDGRVLVRYSGTEPLLRVMMEGPSKPKLEELTGRIIQKARTVLGGA